MNLPQDNEPLREAIEIKMLWLTHTESDHVKESVERCVLELIESEQTRLKADLIAKVREMLPEAFGDTWYAPSATAQVSAALDTLERGA